MKDIYQIVFSGSSEMNKIRKVIGEVAKTDITILIKGESGSGKGLVAQAVHTHSYRKENPFVKVNCAAIPKGLLESELFGFEKGAFTGAQLKKPGKFELANGGTILLNDIEEMDISIQSKLLQVLQDATFSRLGGEGDVRVDTRVIATTKNHLERTVMEGRFRKDLFFRINVIHITVPPLRERKEQILPLSQYYFDLYKKKYRKDVSFFSSKVTHAFKNYHWPGNIRELENMIKRIVIFGDEETVIQDIFSKRSVPWTYPESSESYSSHALIERQALDLKVVGKKAAEIAEKEVIQMTLKETHWNRKKAAKLLCVSYKALLYKIHKYHLDRLGEDQEDQEDQEEMGQTCA